MKKSIKEVLVVLMILIISPCWSQSEVDSVLRKRNIDYLDYRNFKETMGERTWLNMVNLNKKADNVISIDNKIVNDYFYELKNSSKLLKEKVEKLSFELSLLKKEEETSRLLLKENKTYSNIILIIASSFIILFIAALIFLIDRQLKFKSAKFEMERLWANEDKKLSDETFEKELPNLKNQVNNLNIQKAELEKEIKKLRERYEEKEKALVSEMNAKREIEKEIKKMITQIKSK